MVGTVRASNTTAAPWTYAQGTHAVSHLILQANVITDFHVLISYTCLCVFDQEMFTAQGEEVTQDSL